MRVELKAQIFASGLSQRRVAAAAGIPEGRLSQIVRGWIDPKDTERNALALAVGRPVEELFPDTAVAV